MTAAASDDGDATQDADDDDSDDDVTSPLAALMGWVSDPVEQRRQELEIQEKVAECMKAEGFEYTPVDWSAQMPETDVDMSDPKAYGEKYGYGVMYNYETYEIGDGEGEAGVDLRGPEHGVRQQSRARPSRRRTTRRSTAIRASGKGAADRSRSR